MFERPRVCSKMLCLLYLQQETEQDKLISCSQACDTNLSKLAEIFGHIHILFHFIIEQCVHGNVYERHACEMLQFLSWPLEALYESKPAKV